MGQAVIGLNPSQIVAVGAVPAFRPGAIGGYDDPNTPAGYKEYLYAKASVGITGLGYLCGEYTQGIMTMAVTANTGFGARLGAAQAPMVTGEWGWFQIYGPGTLRTLANAALYVRLNTTATDGAVDDDGTATTKTIVGVTLMGGTGASPAANPNAVFSYPTVGPTL